MQEQPSAELYWRTPFLITENKISRIVEVARERLERFGDGFVICFSFTVTLSGNKKIRFDSITSVLGLDNSKSRPIVGLEIECFAQNDEGVVHRISIDFDTTPDSLGLVMLYVYSSHVAWVQETMGALEEQIERVFPSGIVYMLAKKDYTLILPLMMLGAIGLIMGWLFSLISRSSGFGPFKVPANVYENLKELGNNATSDSEKIDFIYRLLMSTNESMQKGWDFRFFVEIRTYLIGIPTVVTMLCALAAILTCYPKTVFAWGDWVEIYDRIVERRKFLWYGVIGSVMVGILGNLFAMGLSTFR